MATGFTELQKSVSGIADTRVVRKALLSLYGDYMTRIYVQGKASDSNPIGKYDAKKPVRPIYVNPADSPKSFPTKGKTGKTSFSNGRKHKTGYFPSYSAFRQAIGRPTDVVNLQLTENMKRGTLPAARGVNFVFGFSNQVEADKAAGNENHFKKDIFDITNAEMKSIPRRMAAAKKELGL